LFGAFCYVVKADQKIAAFGSSYRGTRKLLQELPKAAIFF
jgi:hypothetical protein